MLFWRQQILLILIHLPQEVESSHADVGSGVRQREDRDAPLRLDVQAYTRGALH